MTGGITIGTSIDYQKLRWGHSVEPEWDEGIRVVGVTAGQVLHSFKVPTANVGYLYGFRISVEEPNAFYIRWVDDSTGATYEQIRVVLPSMGTLEFYDKIELGKMYSTSLSYSAEIIVVNACSDPKAGYEAGLFVAWESL